MYLSMIPWLEMAFITAVCGAWKSGAAKHVAKSRHINTIATGLVFVFLSALWIESAIAGPESSQAFLLLPSHWFLMDGINIPLLPVFGLLYFLVAALTPSGKPLNVSSAWLLIGELLILILFTVRSEDWLILILIVTSAPPYLELRKSGSNGRVYAAHYLTFAALLAIGAVGIHLHTENTHPPFWATLAFTLAALIRCGIAPFHCWVTDLFERGAMGSSFLHVATLPGLYALIRLVAPHAPQLELEILGELSLFTAVYAAGMALIQKNTRRFFAYLFLSHSALTLVGAELASAIGMTAALALWTSSALALGGLGLTLRAVESRFGRTALDRYHGLGDSAPFLGSLFFIMALCCVGFPGTMSFIGMELLFEGAVAHYPYIGVAVAIASALNGIAIMKAYFHLFTGATRKDSLPMNRLPSEYFGGLALIVILILGGLAPGSWVRSRFNAAEKYLQRLDHSIIHIESESHSDPGH